MSLKTDIVRAIAEKPQTIKQLKASLSEDTKKLSKALKELEKEKQIKSKKGVYTLAKKAPQLVEGKVVKLGRTFGFVETFDESGDVFIPGHCLLAAMPGDVVLIELFEKPKVAGSREGEVVEILTPKEQVVGTVQQRDVHLVLVPDNAPETPLMIKKSADGGVREGEKAAGHILERGKKHEDIRVGIIQRFGSSDSARQCAKAILFGQGIVKSFPERVKAEAKKYASEEIPQSEINKRLDLRDSIIFTIDSSSAKDLDDAISVKKTKKGYELGVHIADVSYYVRPHSHVDEEAFLRGTSVYYAESVIPMLPKSLSNGVCSLNQGEDRLAFSCLLTLDENGNRVDYSFKKSIINSRIKGVYSEINDIIEGKADTDVGEKYAGVMRDIHLMHELYQKLSKLRSERGAMEIETEEAELILDEDGVCVDVKKRKRGDAERMIEEFMLAANGAAANLGKKLEIPFIYRVHENPSIEKTEQLKNVLMATGIDYKFKGDTPNHKELTELLDKTRGTKLEIPVHTAILRSMAKAKYEPVHHGHFGLALRDYAHFTSPIRRYPDLAIHRILSEVAEGTKPEVITKKYKRFSEEASVQSSERELAAQKIERECDDCYKAEYMKQFIGQAFDGVITSVTSFGVYVGLENTVEGLVHSSMLSQYPLDLREGVELIDRANKTSYRLGNSLSVKLVGVDVSRGHIDFALAED